MAVDTGLQPLEGGSHDYDRLLERVGEARFVLLGEASHGTHDFYRERAAITRRLIAEKGFNAVAVEADWPDARRVNDFVRGRGEDADARAALGGFKRFPAWMWRNDVVLDFVAWLRAHNAGPGRGTPVGFYGLDLYSLFRSIEVFDHYGEDTQAYGYAATLGITSTCEDAVVKQLQDLQGRAFDYQRHDAEAFFEAEQNARLVRNAEEYYRTMFKGRVSSWNLRDTHMAQTLDALARHLENGTRSKIVVWAHNSHLGDARATEMGKAGEHNLGQLVRERHGEEAVLVGFSTYQGTVTAADNWDEPARVMRVRPGFAGSYEADFHALGMARFALFIDGNMPPVWRKPRPQRAIGVIYRPHSEGASHYFEANLADQFDVMIHFDQTRALRPLEPWSEPAGDEAPETYPTGK